MKNLNIIACSMIFAVAGQIFAGPDKHYSNDPVENFMQKQREQEQGRLWRVAQAGKAYEAREQVREMHFKRQSVDLTKGVAGLGVMGLGLHSIHAYGSSPAPLWIPCTARQLLKGFGPGGALCAIGSFFAYKGFSNFKNNTGHTASTRSTKNA